MLLRTEYVLALILAVFLMGISLGSLIVARWGQPRWLRIMPWWVAGFTLLSLWAMPALSAWAEQSHFNSFAQALVMQGLAILLLTLPVTLALGAWLPLLSQHSRSSGMMLYGANSLGAAAGAALAGFVCIPLLGSTGTLMMAALLALILGCYWSGARWQWLGVPVVAWAALLLSPMPSVSSLMPMQMSGSHDVYHYEDAIALTTVVEQADGQRVLLTDLQRRDASTDPTAVFVQGNQARLPLLLHPDPRSILFLGWLEKIYKNIGWVFLEAVMGLETGLDNFAPSSPDHLPPKRHKTGLNRTLGIQIFRQTVTPSNALHLCSFSWHTAAIVCKME